MLGAGRSVVRMQAGARYFPLLQIVQTSRGALPASCSMVTGVLSQDMNLAAHHSLRQDELCLYSPFVPSWHRQVNLYLYYLGVTGSDVTCSDATKFIRILHTICNRGLSSLQLCVCFRESFHNLIHIHIRYMKVQGRGEQISGARSHRANKFLTMAPNIFVSSLRKFLLDTAGAQNVEVTPGCLEISAQPSFRVKFVGKIIRAIQTTSVFAEGITCLFQNCGVYLSIDRASSRRRISINTAVRNQNVILITHMNIICIQINLKHFKAPLYSREKRLSTIPCPSVFLSLPVRPSACIIVSRDEFT